MKRFLCFVAKHELFVFPLITLLITSIIITNNAQMLFLGLTSATNVHEYSRFIIYLNKYIFVPSGQWGPYAVFLLSWSQGKERGRTVDCRVAQNGKISVSGPYHRNASRKISRMRACQSSELEVLQDQSLVCNSYKHIFINQPSLMLEFQSKILKVRTAIETLPISLQMNKSILS